MTAVTLLIDPSGSRNANGPITLTDTGPIATTVDATVPGGSRLVWDFASSGASVISVANDGYVSGNAGTIIAWAKQQAVVNQYVYIVDGTDYVDCKITQYFVDSSTLVSTIGTVRDVGFSLATGGSVWKRCALAWGGGTATAYIDGVADPSFTNQAFTSGVIGGLVQLSASTLSFRGRIAQVVAFDGLMSGAEINAIPLPYTWPDHDRNHGYTDEEERRIFLAAIVGSM